MIEQEDNRAWALFSHVTGYKGSVVDWALVHIKSRAAVAHAFLAYAFPAGLGPQ